MQVDRRDPGKNKYVIHFHEVNFFIKTAVGVVTVFPDDPNPVLQQPEINSRT